MRRVSQERCDEAIFSELHNQLEPNSPEQAANPNQKLLGISSSISKRGNVKIFLYDSNIPLPPPQSDAVRFVAISDTHTQHMLLDLPSGDVLLHLGDFTNTGTLEECADFCSFIAPLPFKHKVLVPGNHDLTCDEESQ